MHVWPAYAFVTVAILWVGLTRGDRDLRSIAIVLAGTWLVSNASHWLLPPDTRVVFPAMDFLIGVGLIMVWGRARKAWMLAMSGLFLVQGATHIIYQHAPVHDFATRYNYDLSLNIGYLLQLGVVLSQTFPARIAANMRSEKT